MLTRMRASWLSFLLIAALLAALLPPVQAKATAVISFSNISTSQSNPTQVTSNSIDIEFLVSGVTIDSNFINNLYYSVGNLNSGTAGTPIRNNKALQNTTNGSMTFSSVKLTQGLNEIYIKYGDPNTVASSAAYVYYTPTTNITNLKFNDADFIGGTTDIYPKTAPATPYISGMSPNADSITATLVGNTTKLEGPKDTQGNFSIFLSRTGSPIKAGDNQIKIVAQNPTNSSYVTRSFVYDDGDAFAFEGQMDNVLGATDPAAFSPLFGETTLQVTSPSVRFKSYLKVPLETNAGVTEMKYNFVEVSVKGGNTYECDLTALTCTDQGSGTTLSLTAVNALSTAAYKVFSLPELPMTLDPMVKEQSIVVSFVSGSGSVPPQTVYSFDYVNPNIPYVNRVEDLLSGVNLSRTPALNGVTRQPITLRAHTTTNPAPSKVEFVVDGMAAVEATQVLNGTTPVAGQYEVTLKDIPDGIRALKVIPYDAGGMQQAAGILTFQLNVSSAPFFNPLNFTDGTIINDLTKYAVGDNYDHDPTSATEYNHKYGFLGRLFNMPSADTTNVIAKLDGVSLTTPLYKVFNDPAVENDEYVAVYLDRPQATKLKDGRHSISLEFYVGGQLVSSASYNFFLFEQPTPAFGNVTPGPDNQDFIKGQSDEYYATTESMVQFTGELNNIDTLKFKITRAKPDNTTQVIEQIYKYSNGAMTLFSSDPTGTATQIPTISCTGVSTNQCASSVFTTINIPILHADNQSGKGQSYFEFTITNNSGITVQKTITIAKEPLPYKVLSPKLVKNSEGKEHVSINSNFLEIFLVADGATSVLFGKEEVLPKVDKGGTITGEVDKEYFYYVLKEVKAGTSTVKFTVMRGTEKTNGSFTIYNANASIEGASLLMPINSTMKVFNSFATIKFPKNTQLMRNDPTAPEKYYTTDRQIYFGLANVTDGRVNKVSDSSSVADGNATFWLREESGRFRAASPHMLWVDAGSIEQDVYKDPDLSKLKEALSGMGGDPYNLNPGNGTAVKFYTRNSTSDLKNLVVPSKRGELTLQYDPSIRSEAWKYVTVMQFGVYETADGYSTLGWRNIGGVVDQKKNTITVPIDSFGYYVPMYMFDSFDDVISHDFARNDLDILYSKGIMKNKVQGLFVPNDPISRGEFATVLVKAFDIPLNYEGTGSFIDVFRYNSSTGSMYDYKYIETAARAGIVRGNAGGRFSPNSTITREEAGVMIARAAELKLSTSETKTQQALQKQFTDATDIEFYARPSIEAIVKAGFITGRENVLQQGDEKKTYRFDPKENITRAETAVIMIRVMKSQKKIPK
ncbi:S-layer homology domain-containing protein [Paenibacillus turpanensis]|uniref:S-layer homology domain-containing protein n=1 Tax=Paenibacillus turpanensis TaxID=2689078 RepID=UPI00140D4B89|nr:S-layer homology domain-containing protein [Paenibacillus turpanensis]